MTPASKQEQILMRSELDGRIEPVLNVDSANQGPEVFGDVRKVDQKFFSSIPWVYVLNLSTLSRYSNSDVFLVKEVPSAV